MIVLHELVHTIQHDGAGTCPGWLIESIADHLRLLAHLDPPHWLKPGQGRRERGWEDAYDAGARFLAWLTGDEAESGGNSDQETETIEDDGGVERGLASMTIARPAQPTRYPQPGESSVGSSESGAKRPPQGRPRPRRPPVPDLVRQMDERMGREKVEEGWWVEMAGATLEELWTEYLDFYASE